MSLWLNDKGLLNTSKLYSTYSQEELKHAQWAKDFLLDYGLVPELKKLDAPDNEYSTLKDIFQATLDHELEITRQCNELATLALKESNHVLYSLASKYCAEQHEEVGKAITNLDILSNSSDMLIVDHYIGDL
jgi:ferritin